MKFKEFSAWCNDRACDGCWSSATAMYCISICYHINSFAFWKRERIWKKEFEETVVRDIVKVIDKKRKDMGYC